MTTTTVRIPPETHSTLRELARQTGQPMHDVLAKAVEAYRRRRMLDDANEVYAAIRSETDLWSVEQEERAAWDATLADDLREP